MKYMNSKYSELEPIISIGLPVFNGEEFLERKINSILSQSFENFELIISNNASTDYTHNICENFKKKDKRIRYFQQKKNMGANWNFNFVLKNATAPFFLWASVNDEISDKFLEKNLEILKNNKKIVGSISKIESLCQHTKISEKNINSFFKQLIKNLRSLKTIDSLPISGTYKNKVRFYLKNSTCQLIYGVFRTDELKKSVVEESFIGNDWATMLNILKFGDFHIVKDDVMLEHIEGLSSTGITNIAKLYGHKNLAKIFPWYPFTNWYIKNFNRRFFLNNLDYFIQLNIEGIISLFLDNLRVLLNKVFKQ